jgi:hypothetical protein
MIDLMGAQGMEVDNDYDGDEDEEDEVENVNDLAMLDRLRLGNDGDGDKDDYLDMRDSDYANYGPPENSDDKTYNSSDPDSYLYASHLFHCEVHLSMLIYLNFIVAPILLLYSFVIAYILISLISLTCIFLVCFICLHQVVSSILIGLLFLIAGD